MGPGPASELNADDDPGEEGVACARHPKVSTVLTCGRCATPICTRCLVQTPVGARCPECAGVRRLPTVDVPLLFLLRGLAAALGAGALAGAVWGYGTGGGRGLGFFTIIIALGVGWAIGEAVSAATNRKRSTSLQACAVAGVVVAYLVHNLVAGAPLLPAGDAFGYLATALAAFIAAQRLRA